MKMRYSQALPNHIAGLLFLLVLAVSGAHAQREEDPLAAGLRQLPRSIGENRTVTRDPGESWVDVGIREHVGYEHLERANPRGVDARELFIPGRHQVSALVRDGVVLNLPELMGFRWANGEPVAWYPVSVGQVARRTPTGSLRVVNRVRNPSWRRPNGTIMPPGPRNPLGDRWLGLNREGYGLHGTNDPTSIGRTVSAGCIRHFPPHIHELFDNARVGMPVIITYETVTIGQEDGIIYMAVFPDVYGRGTNAPSRARERLAAFGLGDVLTGSALERRLASADGVARPLLGSDLSLTVNGTVLATPIGPTLRDGRSFVPLRPVAQRLRARTRWDADSRTVTITHAGRDVELSAGNGQGFLALGSLFVPARALAEGLGGTATYDPRQGVALIIPE